MSDLVMAHDLDSLPEACPGCGTANCPDPSIRCERRTALQDALLAASWPDGSVDGFPTARIARMLADAVLASPRLAVTTVQPDGANQ